MSPTHTRIFVAIIFGFALTTFDATTSSADLSFEDAADKAKIHKLIETLGSDKFSARKSAAQELERMVSDKPLWVTHYLSQQEYQHDPETRVRVESGQPVADAAVLPSFIEAPSGAARSLSWEAWALTDQSGQFRVYRTLDRDDKKLLPPNATMNVRITSRSNDLFPTLASLNSGAAKKITLVRVTQFHKFALLVPGQYEVYVQDLAFHRLTVTEDSPETITFLPKMQKTISGTVVDRATGQPFSGAVVFLDGSKRQGEFAALSTDQWNSLAAADAETLTAHPAYKALSDVYGIQGMGRSDSDGRFELFPEQVGSVYGVIAMSAEKLPVGRRIPSLDELRRKNSKLARINRDVGSMPMFQAAKIKLFPRLKGELENKNVSFWPECRHEYGQAYGGIDR